jgi:cobalt/nickel transport system permease protein
MSHIHIPDGVLPLWLVLVGWIATAVIISLCVRRVREIELARKLPLIGIVSALMIVGMSLEIVPIGYHINMTVIAGIILGPALGFLSAFMVDLILAMFGHGGITVVGLNTLIVGSETVLGFYLFRVLLSFFGKSSFSTVLAAALGTIFTLIISTSLMISVVYISQVNPERALHIEKNSAGRILVFELHGEHGEHEIPADKKINITTFARIVLFLGMFGWVLESAISGLVIRYISHVRPDLILPMEILREKT